MRSKINFIFLIFILCLLVGFLQMNAFFREYYSDSKELIAEAHGFQEQIEREKLHTAIAQNQLLDLREEVAKSLPAGSVKIKNTADYRLKELTQVLREPTSDAAIDLSSVLMERGRTEFKKQDYEKAAKVFREMIEKYPASSQVIDAHFLLGESLFQTGNYDACLDVVYEMVNQFPENEMTGYLMLRNAQILTFRKRSGEAGEIYNLVRQKFSNPGLKEQARRLASEI